jgi:hypothetical protein
MTSKFGNERLVFSGGSGFEPQTAHQKMNLIIIYCKVVQLNIIPNGHQLVTDFFWRVQLVNSLKSSV